MWKTLIYYKPEYIDLAKKLQENYSSHQKDTDIISEEEQDDVEYARENQYDEAIFIYRRFRYCYYPRYQIILY